MPRLTDEEKEAFKAALRKSQDHADVGFYHDINATVSINYDPHNHGRDTRWGLYNATRLIGRRTSSVNRCRAILRENT